MAAQDRFSLHRYSLVSTDNRIEGDVMFASALNAVAGAAVPIDSTAFFGNQALMVSRITATLPAVFSGDASLSTVAEMCANIVGEQLFDCEFSQESNGHKNIYIVSEFDDDLQSFAHAARDLFSKMSAESRLNAIAYGSKTFMIDHLFSAVLTTLTAAGSQETESATIEVTLPPGAELRIDSNAFTVTLNCENILYLQSGAWINVSRDLLRLDIESASGIGLTGTLIYTERFL